MSSRRLSVRRGSASAPDPLGKNTAVNYNPNRSTSSTLTIVRVVDPASSASLITPPDSPPSPILSRRSLRRSTNTSGSSTDNRLSFAFSSFSPVSPTQPSSQLSSSVPQPPSPRAGSSPSSSPRIRPSSPQFVRRHSSSGGSSGFSKPNLTPEQLVDLARQSSVPRYIPGQAVSSHSDVPAPSPATFTVLPDDVYLPFIDRVAETTYLLSIPPTKKLFSLLAQTFPAQPRDVIQDPFNVDPTQWSFHTLRRWLTEIDRTSASDAIWVRKARKCVLSHSELIWERLKGALGVPPELELEALNNGGSADMLVIEPIMATSSSNPPPISSGGNNLPPSSLPTCLSQSSSMSQSDLGLQDIVEDREEEEDEKEEKEKEDPSQDLSQGFTRSDEAQIHGLRLCTSSVPPSATHLLSHPPTPSTDALGGGTAESNSPSYSHPPPLTSRRLSRTSSRESITSLGRRMSGRAYSGS